MDIRLETITVYPVKSLGGIPLEKGRITPRGLQDDRVWVLIDENGKFLSQRGNPSLARVKVKPHQDGLVISTSNQEDLVLKAKDTFREPDMVNVQIWDDQVRARRGPDYAEQWFSRFLGQTCHLAYMSEDCHRPVTSSKAPAGHEVGFADAYPLLAVSGASLDLLNSKLENPLPMDRFRANLIFSGCGPHAEDEWGRFCLGESVLQAVKPCPRCSVPAVDQTTGLVPNPGEPLRTLATYRQQPEGVMFGMNLIVIESGDVQVGDKLIRT